MLQLMQQHSHIILLLLVPATNIAALYIITDIYLHFYYRQPSKTNAKDIKKD